MNIQELKKFFGDSDYSDETKIILAGVLDNKTEVTPGLISQVKDILQKELDVDFEKLGIDVSNDPEAQKIEKEYGETLTKIEKDLEEDMNFVEEELKELEEIRKKVDKIADEMEADNIKASI